MSNTNATAPKPRGAGRTVVAIAALLVLLAGGGWYWFGAHTGPETQSPPPASTGKPPVSEMPGSDVFETTVLSGPEITAALSDHTASLPGGFVEYYSPDGKVHGTIEGKHYSGSWEVRDNSFCTILQDSDTRICSPVRRQGTTLYWSQDGEQEASAVALVPGNPQNLP